MRFPDVLFIGAMKCGTTSLYMDLAQHPQVFLSEDKEPRALCSDEVYTAHGQARYAAIYSSASANQVCIDASTDYSKLPDIQGVAKRALDLLPKGFKVIYVVRHPIDRIISQHYHEYSRGEVGSDINLAVREHPRFINYSRYAYQLEPWIEAVGRECIKVVLFEDYTEKRTEIVEDLYRFLGFPENLVTPDSSKVYNKSEGKPVLNSFWSNVYGNWMYRKVLRPLIPLIVRTRIRELVLPRAPERPAPLSQETKQWLKSNLTTDVANLYEIQQIHDPWWNDFAWNTNSGQIGTQAN